MKPNPRIVASLLGRAQVAMAISCLGSLLTKSHDPLGLRLHDDGTLGPEERERLAVALGNPEIVSRSEADDRTAPWLKNRPALAALRRRHPLFLKLVDLIALAPDGPTSEESVAYVDADVLFVRPLVNLFVDLPRNQGAVFMADVQNAYSVRSWHLLFERRLQLPARLNSGLFQFRRDAFDPDLLEWFAAKPEYQFSAPWIEQTAWALLAAKARCSLYDADQIVIPAPSGPLPLAAVALHFVGPVRARLAEALAAPARTSDDPTEIEIPIGIRSAPAQRLTPWALAATEAGRLLRRLRS